MSNIISPKTPYGMSFRKLILKLDFDIQEYRARILALTHQMRDLDLDALLIYEHGADTSNTRYLTGFAVAPTWIGASMTLVRANGDIVLLTSAIAHGEPMHSNIQTAWLEDVRCLKSSKSEDFTAEATGILTAWSARTVGVHHLNALPFGLHQQLTAADHLKFVDASTPLPALRRIKSTAEIEVLRRLGSITAQGMAAAVDAVRIGASESAIAAAAHYACVAAGAELMTFGCFVATGARSALKNVAARPDHFVNQGELTMIDLGCKLNGYQSDMSRNVVIGDIDLALADMLDACDAALTAGKHAARAGVMDYSVVKAVRDVVAERGYGLDDYTICHSYGLDLVEEPRFDPLHPVCLDTGMSFYIEPMIIPPAIGSICIEDMVLMTNKGCETLTPHPTRFWPS